MLTSSIKIASMIFVYICHDIIFLITNFSFINYIIIDDILRVENCCLSVIFMEVVNWISYTTFFCQDPVRCIAV